VALAAMTAAGLLTIGTASSAPVAKKQRISLVGTFSTLTGTGTWRLVPLTPGPLEADSGTLTGSGSTGPTTFRNGQRVVVITGGDTMTGKRGAFAVTQSVESTNVGRRYSADIGTWSLRGGTGAYEGLTGKGRFAAVGLPNGTLLVNQEGWVVAR
jgi:hypothetical protein